ncbi:MAG: pyridoxal-dependent decarboxylase, exosortase A system-associated [Halieaceae bacterium]|nr:pyridoxal-dependent decarboxylase, exosortase A system-associated [Halieaceae bacterium]
MSESNVKTIPRHAPMNQFEVVNNCLTIGGQAITEITSDVGRTPFYAYDRSVMTEKVESLRRALPKSIHLHYAMKANPMPEVVQHLANETDGLDVASAAELEVALSTGTDPSDISFAGPGKSDEDLRAAVASGVIINMESPTEMTRIAALAKATGRRPTVSIRVNPDFELKAAGMKMGSGPKPFGVDAENVPDMLAELSKLPLEFMGFHIFSGSQNLREDAIMEAQAKTFELAYKLAEYAPAPLRWLNIGGGLGIPYFPGEQRLDLAPIAANLAPLLETASKKLPGAEIVMELGRYLTAEAGIYVCEIVDRKVSRGEIFLITNGGLHHHLAASGNFGQVIRKNYPLCLGNRVNAPKLETVQVVGPLCTPLDLLGNRVELPPAGPGDLVVLFQSGAYGFSASPRDFLSHPQPAQILL